MTKRPDGYYQLSVAIGFGDDGKPKRKVVYGKTQKDVQEKANTLRMQHNMGIEIDNNISVAEWAKTWLEMYKSGVQYNTLRMYTDIANNYIIKPLGGMRLKDVKLAHLQNIVNKNRDKSWVVKKFKLTVTQIFEQAMINDIIVKNPAKGIKLPVLYKKQTKRALTEEEQKRIKSIDLDAKTKCYVFLLLYTGMRKSEALALTKSDIDCDRMEITVSKTLIFKVNQSEVKHNPKTKAGVRTIPLLEPLKDVLVNYMDGINTEMLFLTATEETFTDTAYRRMWQKFEKAMGTKEITAHIFRHNFATILYNADVNVKMAQAILGHSSIAVTMDVYTHLDSKKQSEATAKLNAHLLN